MNYIFTENEISNFIENAQKWQAPTIRPYGYKPAPINMDLLKKQLAAKIQIMQCDEEFIVSKYCKDLDFIAPKDCNDLNFKGSVFCDNISQYRFGDDEWSEYRILSLNNNFKDIKLRAKRLRYLYKMSYYFFDENVGEIKTVDDILFFKLGGNNELLTPLF